MLKIFLLGISFYQKYLSFDSGILRILAPGGACRQVPRCSEYMKEKMVEKGVLKGGILGVKRILNCY